MPFAAEDTRPLEGKATELSMLLKLAAASALTTRVTHNSVDKRTVEDVALHSFRKQLVAMLRAEWTRPDASVPPTRLCGVSFDRYAWGGFARCPRRTGPSRCLFVCAQSPGRPRLAWG
jgi:hypothetical protein